MSKKIKSPAAAIPAAAEEGRKELETSSSVSVIAASPETPAAEPEKKPLGFRTLGARDSFGFGSDTEPSFLSKALESGKYTRKELLAAFLAAFGAEGNESETRRKKTSFSVFFSDSRRPIGTYHASRNFVILEEEGTGKLSLDPERTAAVKAAIAAGILKDLRGLDPKGRKAAEVRAKYSLPSEEK